MFQQRPDADTHEGLSHPCASSQYDELKAREVASCINVQPARA